MNALQRTTCPVFVVGSPRSGTTLAYHLLTSSGRFVNYRTESHVFRRFAPAVGSLARRGVREKFAKDWAKTEYFRRSGLIEGEIVGRIVRDARTWGDFLRIVMESMAARQGVSRWAECTPQHVLHLREIAEAFPTARIVHMIRDGRDVALSLDRKKWVRKLPGDRHPSILAAGAYWNWIVRRGSAEAERSGLPVLELKFEDLVLDPQAALNRLGEFIGEDLDHEEIQRNAVGSVAQPNTSFDWTEGGSGFQPAYRWRTQMEPAIQRAFERRFAPLLSKHGYSVPSDARQTRSLYDRVYSEHLALKQWAKFGTPLGRLGGHAGVLGRLRPDPTLPAPSRAHREVTVG